MLSKGTNLIYGRTFEGWSGEDRSYFELSQEFSHLEELHWRPEHNGYCRFDKNGNLELVATISKRNSEDLLSLVTFDWNSLECYLSTSDQVLVRLFDFTLVDRKSFVAWGNENISFVDVSTDLFYKQCIQGTSSYTRGVQIIAPRRSKAVVSSALTSSWFGGEGKEHVDFIAQDWRNECITRISTDPAATTNYFEANGNNLPFELSPAFFNPEVLSKYKADKEKYIIRERSIQCRDSWVLEAMDENEAGQIFAYIVYLRRLPESELKYWASFNERPKAPISERARINDFEGQWVMKMDPLEKVKNIVREWDQLQYAWWKLRDIRLIDEVTVPLTSSRDEWADSFLSLAKLVIEGFVIRELRKHARSLNLDFENQEGSLSLLEKILNSCALDSEERLRLSGLRSVQEIRTKVKGHSARREADILAANALQEHESFSAHFRHICDVVSADLSRIQDKLTDLVEQ